MVIPHILYQTTLFHQEINVILNLLKVHEYLKKNTKYLLILRQKKKFLNDTNITLDYRGN
jgi:hypothetical protein